MIEAGGSKECPCFRVFGSVREGALGRGDIMSVSSPTPRGLAEIVYFETHSIIIGQEQLAVT